MTYRKGLKITFIGRVGRKRSKSESRIVIYVKKCKPLLQFPVGMLQPLFIPDSPRKFISMDFIFGIPKSCSMIVFFVVIDRLTKYAHFLPLAHPFGAAKMTTLFMDNIIKLHGWPLDIISDRDSIFMSHFWIELMHKNGVKLLRSTNFHPQADGQIEAVNKSIKAYLRRVSRDTPSKWTKYLPLAELWYNTKFHIAIQLTPFEALYGYPPSIPTTIKNTNSLIEAVAYTMKTRDEINKLL